MSGTDCLLAEMRKRLVTRIVLKEGGGGEGGLWNWIWIWFGPAFSSSSSVGSLAVFLRGGQKKKVRGRVPHHQNHQGRFQHQLTTFLRGLSSC